MENDVLRNKIVPWQEKGRWYHGVIDAVSHTFITEKTDKFLLDSNKIRQTLGSTSGVYILASTSINVKILDIKIKLSNDFVCANGIFPTSNLFVYSGMNGTGYGVYPSSATAGSCEVWVFIVEE